MTFPDFACPSSSLNEDQRTAREDSFTHTRLFCKIVVIIDQAMFLDFLDTFNQAAQASPWIEVINFTNIAAFFVPSATVFAIKIAVYLTVKSAQEVHGRAGFVPRRDLRQAGTNKELA